MANRLYVFTREELYQLLDEHSGLVVEFRDRHGKTEPDARNLASLEILGGLDAEDLLYRQGECATTHVREEADRG